MKNRIVSNISSHKTLNNYKGKNCNFSVEYLGRHHLNQMIKVNIISIGIKKCHVPPDVVH